MSKKKDDREEQREKTVGFCYPGYFQNPGSHIGDQGDHGPGYSGHREKTEIIPKKLPEGKGIFPFFLVAWALTVWREELPASVGIIFHG